MVEFAGKFRNKNDPRKRDKAKKGEEHDEEEEDEEIESSRRNQCIKDAKGLKRLQAQTNPDKRVSDIIR